SPFKVARGPANLFGDQVGDMKNLARVDDARLDERYDNTIQYTTPTFNGFNARLGYSVHEGPSATEDHESDSVSLSLNYAGGPVRPRWPTNRSVKAFPGGSATVSVPPPPTS